MNDIHRILLANQGEKFIAQLLGRFKAAFAVEIFGKGAVRCARDMAGDRIQRLGFTTKPLGRPGIK